MTPRIKLTRPQAAAAGGLLAVAVLVVIAVVLLRPGEHPIGVRLEALDREHVRVLQPVSVRFDQPVDLSRTTVTVTPANEVTVTRRPDSLVVIPAKPWQPDTTYTLRLGVVANPKHRDKPLRGWKAAFTTQPKVGAAYRIDGSEATGNARMTPSSKLQIVFLAPMKPSVTVVTVNDQPAPPAALKWESDGQTVTVSPPGILPYQPFKLAVSGGETLSGHAFTGAAPISIQPVALLPSNTTSGVAAGFQTRAPIEVVIENAGPARPQSGLQAADMVYEYISEYSISRMTAIYFNEPAPLIGPVRSCRMVNPFLGFAFSGLTMCSGGSVGTLHYMFGNPQGDPLVPGTINDFDQGNHFFRVNFKPGPHNLFTEAARANRLREEWRSEPPPYAVDPPHDDADAGVPADAPSVPLHAVGYNYDAGARAYLRFDHGAPFTDSGNSDRQVAVKNVVLLHAGFRGAGWVEDDNGGAGSIWYDLLGAGAAEIYSNGKLVRATWHMGRGGDQKHWQNREPVYFTDESGNPIRLNTGLTWVHVLGNGQTG